MSNTSPTLHRLFRRSRYITRQRPLDEDDESPEAEKKREERERWLVAALGHVLTHDKGFREEFWNGVCCQDDKEVPDRIEVAVELKNSADLCLTASCKSRTIVCVIEAKAGAKLDDHQNPDRTEFMDDLKGYGKALQKASLNANSELRYVVLGHRGELLRLGKNPLEIQPPIQVLQHPWSKIANITVQSDLVKDLFKTFAAFGISAFTMKDLKFSLTPADIAGAAKAQAILIGVLENLGITKGQRRLDSQYDGLIYFGYYIPSSCKGGLSATHSKLLKASNRSEGDIAWIGYGADENGTPRREVWIYVDKTETAKPIETRLKLLQWLGATIAIDDKDIPPNVMLNETVQGELSDFEFFRQALRQAANE
jgi:hypothetical protein